jgi:hypothetical protein
MKFSTFPDIVQDALRDKFLAEAEGEFDSMEEELIQAFLAGPEVAKLWMRYREQCYDDFMHGEDAAETWHAWLEDHGIDPH